MKIVVTQNPVRKVKFLTDAGVDITEELCVSKVSIVMDPEGDFVSLHLNRVDLECDFDYGSVFAAID